MYYATILTATLTQAVDEKVLDEIIQNLNSFKTRARKAGKLRGMDNHIYNIYDETEFDEVSNKFNGNLRIYFETNSRNDQIVDDIKLVCDHYQIIITQFVRKFTL